MACTVRVCATPTDRDAAMSLRRAVFVGEQGVPADLEADAYDAEAVHLLAIDATGAVLGVGRIVPLPDGAAKIGRVAVRRDARGTGVGAAVMAAAHAQVRALGRRRAVLHAQAAVVGFYLGLGYVAVGPRFSEAGIEHQRMELDVGSGPGAASA